jgi:hypothetical protein
VAPAAMSEQEKKLDGPDFARGVPLEDLAEGSMILGQAAGEVVPWTVCWSRWWTEVSVWHACRGGRRRQEHFPGYATSSKWGEKLPVAVDYVGVDLSWRSLLGKTQIEDGSRHELRKAGPGRPWSGCGG